MIGRWFTIRACVRDLSQRLAREYGLRWPYTREEVDAVLRAWDMRLAVPAYAYAIYCTRGEFERLETRVRSGRDYDEYRRDVERQYPRLDGLEPA